MFKWLKERISNKPLYPECLWVVELLEEGIRGADQTGKAMTVPFDGLKMVAIATDGSGPWGDDVWWLMYGADGALACAFPQGATGEQAVLDYLFALPGFNDSEASRAMGSTSEATFIVWQRSA